MKIRISALTDTGKERSNNEDAFVICPNLLDQIWDQEETSSYIPLGELGTLLVVADGMGGENAGEVASSEAIKTIKGHFDINSLENISKTESGICEFMNTVLMCANEAICEKMKENPDTDGMGTTIVVCWVINETAYIAWCGDSRCYLYNPHNGLKQITKDHSYVQELIDNGEITEEEAFDHPDSNIITNYIGEPDSITIPGFISYPIEPNDYLLLCSDGLSGLCKFEQIERVMNKYYYELNECRDNLLQLALNAGGSDNITIVLASFISNSQKCPATISFFSTISDSLKRFFYK